MQSRKAGGLREGVCGGFGAEEGEERWEGLGREGVGYALEERC